MIRLLAFLFVLLATPALAEPPVCTGKDLSAVLKASDPAKYRAVMKEAARVPNGRAIFWKIESKGHAPSWLLGTAHVTDPRVTTLPRQADRALGTSSVVVLELAEIATPGLAELKVFGNASLMVLPLGKTIWDYVPDDQEKLIRGNPNLEPGEADRMAGFQPWVIATAMALPPCEKDRAKAGIKALDQMIGQRARSEHIPVAGLETVAEQLQVFAGLPMDKQVIYLLAVAKRAPELTDQFETLIRAYAKRQIATIALIAKATEPMSDEEVKLGSDMEETLLRQRNLRMADRMVQYLDKGNAFVAVGALHLVGKEGLVALLRAKGYKVTPIN